MGVSLALGLGTVMGCGYHFRPTGSPRGVEIRSLAVPLVESPSSSLGFEGDVTRIIRGTFLSHATIPIVPEGQASTLLIARVKEIRTKPQSYALSTQAVQGQSVSYETTATRWLEIRMEVELIDQQTGKRLWRESGMIERASYAVDADPLKNRYNERKAVEVAAMSLARRIFAQTMERF
jgi:hypothetical protein